MGKYFLVILYFILLNILKNEDANKSIIDLIIERPLLLRIVIVCSALLLIILTWKTLSKKNKKKGFYNNFKHIIENDLITPSIVFLGLFSLEKIVYLFHHFDYWMLGFVVLSVGIILFYFFKYLNWFPKNKSFKNIREFLNGFSNKYFFLLLMALPFLLIGYDIEKTSHFFFELLPILLTFSFYSYLKNNQLYEKENDNQLGFWDSYKTALKKIDVSLVAFNTGDYNNFTEPLGYRYFAEQMSEIKKKQEIVFKKYLDSKKQLIGRRYMVQTSQIKSYESDIILKRFFVIDDVKSQEDLIKCAEINCLGSKETLSDKERNFKAIYALHIMNNIQVFLMPKYELECFVLKKIDNEVIGDKKLKELLLEYKAITNKGNSYIINLEYFERLIINNDFYITGVKDKSMYFEPSKYEFDSFIFSIIKKFDNDNYNAKVIYNKLVNNHSA